MCGSELRMLSTKVCGDGWLSDWYMESSVLSIYRFLECPFPGGVFVVLSLCGLNSAL